MNNSFVKFKELSDKHTRKKRWLRVISVLSCIVVFCTTYALIIPAITMGKDVYCGNSEHEHSLQCYSDSSKTESQSHWEQSLKGIDISGNWADDLVSVAKSQLGYSESTENYEVQADGETMNGYTRYGDWYGNAYGDWSAMFVSFCLNYAEIGETFVPYAQDCSAWVDELTSLSLYSDADTLLVPQKGDIVFYDFDNSNTADAVGIITDVNTADNTFKAVRGDVNGQVDYYTCSLSDSSVLGYGLLPENPQLQANSTIQCLADNGAIVTLQGNLPDGAEIRLSSVSDETLFEILEQVDSEASVFAYDITIVDGDGSEWQPDRLGVKVSITGLDLPQDETVEVVHVPNNGEIEQVDVEQTDNGVEFMADGFSVYMAYLSSTANEEILVVMGSDFQDPATSYSSSYDFADNGNYTTQVSRIKTIMSNIKSALGTATAYGFIGGGDYGYDRNLTVTETNTGISNVKSAVTDVFGSDVNTIFVQGNHDDADSNVASSGANDTDYYGVFVLNEDDYSNGGGTESIVKSVASKLDTYLSAKKESGYDKPIFITSHVPLHYSCRTVSKGDAKYADTIFNVINKYGNDLNIIFLYGHNHAYGDDDYLGGSAVFLTKGNTINIAEHGSQSAFTKETLNFTYMNYGYTGYYWACGSPSSSSEITYGKADNTLTMTAFVISGNSVSISRWDESGMHVLKHVGAAIPSASRNMDEVCTVTTNSVASPCTVSLSTATSDDTDDTGDTSGFVFPEVSQTTSGTYWVKCTATTDLDSSSKYMIVSSSSTALGIKSASDKSVTSYAATFTEKGTTGGKTYYELSGDADTDLTQFTLSGSDTSWKIMCANSSASGYGVRLGSSSGVTFTNTSDSITSNTFGLQDSSKGIWQIYYKTRYLIYNGSSFAKGSTGTTGTTANMTLYKQITVSGGSSYNQLAVQKDVSEYTSKVTADTEFTFKLSSASSSAYSSASAVTGVTYKIYSDSSTVSSTGTLTDGTFSLKAGQTAYFELPKSDTVKYFVSEVVANSDTSIETITAKINGTTAAVTKSTGSSTTDHYVPVSYSSDGQCLVRVTNTPAPVISYLEIALNNSGTGDGTVTDSTNFTFTVKDNSGNAAVYTKYQFVDASGNAIGSAVNYASSTPSITMHSGQRVRIYGLADAAYTVSEALGSVASSVYGVSATIDNSSAVVTSASDTASTALTYSGQQTLVFTNELDDAYTVTFDFRDGTMQTITANEDGTLSYEWPTKTRSGLTLEYWSTTRDDETTKVTESTSYAFTKNTTLYAHWQSTQTDLEKKSDAALTKTLRETTAYVDTENYENFFDIDLSATLPAVGDQILVLVFDLSGSMTTQCMNCGLKHGDGTGDSGKSIQGYDGTYYTPTACDNYVERLTVTAAKANEFITKLSDSLADGSHCYVSVVGFNAGAFEVLGETDLATDDGETAILKAISYDNLKSYGENNTSLGAGLYQGYLHLTASLTAHPDIDSSNSCVILLSDGVPTTLSSEKNKYTDSAWHDSESGTYQTSYYVGPDAVTNSTSSDYIAKWQAIWSTIDHYEWLADNMSPSGADYSIYQIMAPPYIAEQIQNTGSSLYTISLGENYDKYIKTGGKNYKYVAGIGILNYSYLSSFSDSCVFVNTAEGLESFYNEMLSLLTTSVSDVTVTDPMSEYVEFVRFTAGSYGDTALNVSDDGTKLYNGDTLVASYDSSTRTITWNPAYDGTISYKVRLKNEASGFLDWDDSLVDYTTNGETTISYKVTTGGTTTDKSKNVDVPYVHGWLGELQFTKVGGKTNDSTAKVLPGVTFTLHHDPTTCSVCQHLSSDVRAYISDITVTSDVSGIVSFANVPSGHTYTMTESTPTGYSPGTSYTVNIAYGKTTVTSVGDDNGYWSVTDGQYRLFNLDTGGYILPNSGGIGDLLFIFGALSLMAAAVIYGYITRRKNERRNE